MGQSLARRCDSVVGEARAGYPGCPSATLFAQRRRVEDLILEVDEARAENSRLSKQADKLRAKLKELKPVSLTQSDDAIQEGVIHQPDRRLNEEMLQLKRVLWDLQRENAVLKEEQARGDLGERPSSGNGCSLSEYEALQHQIEDLRRAHDSAVAQTERLRARLKNRECQFFSSPQRLPRPSRRSHAGSMDDDDLRAPRSRLSSADDSSYGRRSYAGSMDEDYGGRSSIYGSAPSSCAPSGMNTPVTGGMPTPLGGHRGRALPYDADGAEVRRRVQSMELENEQLKRKVRMLAAT